MISMVIDLLDAASMNSSAVDGFMTLFPGRLSKEDGENNIYIEKFASREDGSQRWISLYHRTDIEGQACDSYYPALQIQIF